MSSQNLNNILSLFDRVDNTNDIDYIDYVIEANKLKVKIKHFKDISSQLFTHLHNAKSQISDFRKVYIDIVGTIEEDVAYLRLDYLNKSHKVLNHEIEVISSDKADLEVQIQISYKFNRQFTFAHIELLKRLKSIDDRLDKLLFERLSKINSINEAKQYIKDTYENYENNKGNEDISNVGSSDKEAKKDLKTLWKECSKLSHPDVVSAEFYELSNSTMQEINEAYELKDKFKLEMLYFKLDNGLIFSSINDNTMNTHNDIYQRYLLIKEEYEELKYQIKKLQQNISNLKSDDLYILSFKLDDWSTYFLDIRDKAIKDRVELEKLIYALDRQLDDILSKDNNSFETNDEMKLLPYFGNDSNSKNIFKKMLASISKYFRK